MKTLSPQALLGAFLIVPAGLLHAGTNTWHFGSGSFQGDAKLYYTHAFNRTNYTGYLGGSANANILGRDVPLAQGDSIFVLTEPNRCTSSGTLKLGRKTVANWNKSFTKSTTWTSERFYDEAWGGSYRFYLAGYGVEMAGKAALNAYTLGTAAVDTRNLSAPRVQASIGPACDAAATGELYARLPWTLSVDLNGSLNLTGVRLAANLDFQGQTNGVTKATYSAVADLQDTTGQLKARLTWFGMKIADKKWDYQGQRTSMTIASGSRNL